VTDLRGRRVDIGAPASGTRFDAVAILAAHGVALEELQEAREEGLTAAIARLRRKELDALFVTIAAPARPLQQLAVEAGLRLLPMTGDAIEQLGQTRPGLMHFTLPANTYPRQHAPVVTVASSALLLTTADAPEAEVERVTALVFRRMPQQPGGSADVVKVSQENHLRGVTIPLHPGAAHRAP
jgi:TRAP transporter TAXI family solute receptor